MLCLAYIQRNISLLSSYSIVPSSVLETHKDWACLTDQFNLAGAVENCFIPLLYLTMSSHRVPYSVFKMLIVLYKKLIDFPFFGQINFDNVFCPMFSFITTITKIFPICRAIIFFTMTMPFFSSDFMDFQNCI